MAEEDCRTWRLYQEKLQALEKIQVPRWLARSQHDQSVELHGFSDASERAYDAVIYLRTVNHEEVQVSLVAAKSRVAPLKPVSLPRLELCAAVLLT